MKKIRIDEKDVDLLATPYSLVLYRREFGDDKDLVNDSMTLVQGFQNGKINGCMETDTTFIWAYRIIELYTIAEIGLYLASIVHPCHTESEDTVRFYQSF